jgi:hypothetical protein
VLFEDHRQKLVGPKGASSTFETSETFLTFSNPRRKERRYATVLIGGDMNDPYLKNETSRQAYLG